MSTALIEKMRKARESSVAVGGFTFTYRRPTDEESLELRDMPFLEVCRRFVTGWDNVKEIDLVPGGDPVPAKFSPELWAQWLADRPDFWPVIHGSVIEAYKAYAKKRDTSAKN